MGEWQEFGSRLVERLKSPLTASIVCLSVSTVATAFSAYMYLENRNFNQEVRGVNDYLKSVVCKVHDINQLEGAWRRNDISYQEKTMEIYSQVLTFTTNEELRKVLGEMVAELRPILDRDKKLTGLLNDMNELEGEKLSFLVQNCPTPLTDSYNPGLPRGKEPIAPTIP